MDINFIKIHSLLYIICILFLSFNIINSSLKFLRDGKYTFFDFRISLFTLIFLFIKISFSLLLVNKFEIKTYISSILTLFLCFIGWHLHNKFTDSRKKHFRILIFFLIGLIIFIVIK